MIFSNIEKAYVTLYRKCPKGPQVCHSCSSIRFRDGMHSSSPLWMSQSSSGVCIQTRCYCLCTSIIRCNCNWHFQCLKTMNIVQMFGNILNNKLFNRSYCWILPKINFLTLYFIHIFIYLFSDCNRRWKIIEQNRKRNNKKQSLGTERLY